MQQNFRNGRKFIARACRSKVQAKVRGAVAQIDGKVCKNTVRYVQGVNDRETVDVRYRGVDHNHRTSLLVEKTEHVAEWGRKKDLVNHTRCLLGCERGLG